MSLYLKGLRLKAILRVNFQRSFFNFLKAISYGQKGLFLVILCDFRPFEPTWNKTNGEKNRKIGFIKKYLWPLGGTRFYFWWSEVLSWVKFSGKHKVLIIKKRFFWALPSAWLSLAILLTRCGPELPEMPEMP